MSRFKLSNQIFDLGLSAQELSIYAYLCSLPSVQNTITGEATVCVKQSTIAQNCGIRSVQTVAKIILSDRQGAYRASGTFCKGKSSQEYI